MNYLEQRVRGGWSGTFVSAWQGRITFSGNAAADASLLLSVMIFPALGRGDNPNSGTGTYLWFSDRVLASLQSGGDRRCGTINAPELVSPTRKLNVFNALTDTY